VAISSVFLAVYQTIMMFTIIWIIDYIFWSFGDPARFKINAGLAGKEKGKILSLFGLVVALGQGAGFAVAAKVVEMIGYHGMFYLRAVLFIMAGLLMLWLQGIVKHEHTRAH
jgi:MFS family permease